MTTPIKRIVIVGGGTAGWLTACMLAAAHRHCVDGSNRPQITLVESQAIGTVGVGEGTWPTMRETLHKIGLPERDLLRHASAAFKQGSKFVNWHQHSGNTQRNQDTHVYHHPFSAPQGSASGDITAHWLAHHSGHPYAESVCFQPAISDAGLAPKSFDVSARSPVANYGYHLDAGQFISLLKQHGTGKLGIHHVVDDVTDVIQNEQGIGAVATAKSGSIEGDLFVDCSGFRALLIGDTLGVSLSDCSDILLADRALVCQQPYDSPTAAIACYTQSTAQHAGWIWDIGLQQRRGLGYVYSSAFSERQDAEDTLARYLEGTGSSQPEVREIRFKTGYRTTPWQKNCVAIGLSAGFLEPLEASALMLIEQSADLLASQLPANTAVMAMAAQRFNDTVSYQWARTIEFLKLHYLLSNRTEPFWQANREPGSIPDILAARLEEWRYRPPLDSDFPHRAEVFSAQSYRYILYGGAPYTRRDEVRATVDPAFAEQQFALNRHLISQLSSHLPSHRALIEHLSHDQ